MTEIALSIEGLSYNNTVVTNFSVSDILPCFSVQNPEKMVAIELKIHAPDGVHQVSADITSSITDQIRGAVPSCRLFMNKPELIDAYLIQQAASAGKGRILCREFGLQRFNGNWIFIAGDEILGNCGTADMVIHPSVSKAQLAWDREGNKREAVVRVLHAMSNNEMTVFPSFMYFCLSSLRSQVSGLVTTYPALYLTGQQNSGKTWLVEHYTQLYNDKETRNIYGNLDASSTDIGVIRVVSEFKDLVVAVDDLPKSSSPDVQRGRLAVMEKSIRFISNGSERVTASKNVEEASRRCQAGAVYTGEISLATASILTRILEVPLTGHKKTAGVSDRADAATAFREWMLWLLSHLDTELDALKKRLKEIHSGEHVRLEATKILLLWTTELFYRFALEQDFIGEDYYHGAMDQAEKIFDSLLTAQAVKVQRIQAEVPHGNLSCYILEGYHSGAFRIVCSRDEIKCDSDCLVEKDALCIRTETLLEYLCGQSAFRTLTKKGMSKRLRDEGLLADTAEKRAATKKIKKKRYLELNLTVLKKSVQKY